MSLLDNIIGNLPEIKPPAQKKLAFKEKLIWTSVILLIYFLLGLVPLYGLEGNVLQQFEFLSIVLGASFGSIITLGIGPIVTASIVLQLLNGSGLVKFDLTSHEGKRRYQGIQKMLSVFFVILEAFIFVQTGGLTPQAGVSPLILILQLTVGGIFIMMMDEIVSKYGFGSGISLFIAAGVAHQVFIGLFSWLDSPINPGVPAGAIPAIAVMLGAGSTQEATIKLGTVIATALVFLIVVYVQAMKVEIPLSFGRVAGHGIRWPLNFLYTGNIPVILISALIANVHLIGQISKSQFLTTFLQPPNVLNAAILGAITGQIVLQALFFIVIYTLGSLVFSIFWVQTSGMDPSSQARQMINSGLQVPGFRRDQRVLEKILERYIKPLTWMGGIAIGLLASIADLTGAIGTGTGLLLAVMIIYRLYEDIAKQHMYDMNPMMRKFMTV